MMDAVAPGRRRAPISTDDGAAAIRARGRRCARRFRDWCELYDNTASLQDRTVGTGRAHAATRRGGSAPAASSGAPRAAISTRARDLPYPPYDAADLRRSRRATRATSTRASGSGSREVEQSLDLIEQMLGALPAGAIRAAPTRRPAAGEGLALVEGFRGDVLRLRAARRRRTVARCHLRDPSWLQWPLLEAAIEGNIVADFPLCNKSFNCSYSGHDL